MDLGVLLESSQGSQSLSRVGHARALSFRAVTAVSLFPSRGSRDLCLSLEAFPRGFPTGLSHVPPWCESFLGLKVEAVQGNRFPWNELRNLGDSGNGGTTLEFLCLSCRERLLLRCDGNGGNSFPSTQGKDPSIELGGGNGAPLDVGGTLVLPLEWIRVCRELLELQNLCEGPFGSSGG